MKMYQSVIADDQLVMFYDLHTESSIAHYNFNLKNKTPSCLRGESVIKSFSIPFHKYDSFVMRQLTIYII